jgi:hypothetical protein
MRKAFCSLRNLIGDFRHQISDSLIVDLLTIKTRIIRPEAPQIKECAEILREVHYLEKFSFQEPLTIPEREL